MDYQLIATTTFGIEAVTAKELRRLGYEDLKLENNKTKNLVAILKNLNINSALFVDNSDYSDFRKACSNLYKIDVIPSIGLNVYDGLRHEKIVLTKSAVESIQERLG